VINGRGLGDLRERPGSTRIIGDKKKKNFRSTKGERWTVLPGGTFVLLGDIPTAYSQILPARVRRGPRRVGRRGSSSARPRPESRRDEHEVGWNPLLDVTDAIQFLALENAFINQDGYGDARETAASASTRPAVSPGAAGRRSLALRPHQVSEYGTPPFVFTVGAERDRAAAAAGTVVAASHDRSASGDKARDTAKPNRR